MLFMIQNARKVLCICAKYMIHYKFLHGSNFFVYILDMLVSW